VAVGLPFEAQADLNAQRINAAETVRDAKEVLDSIQENWEKLVSQGPETAADDILTKFLPFIEFKLMVTVPAGENLNVDIAGLTITDASRSRSRGWKKGDRVLIVNGEDMTNFEDIKAQVKASQKSNSPIKLIVERRQESPFARLLKAMQGVYEDTDAPLTEPDEVLAKVSSLKNKATLLVDGIGDTAGLRKKVDAVSKELNTYVAAWDKQQAPKEEEKSKSASSDSGDLDGLFR
jgi:membrane-associated protease RseP (regulator of RpoE activity)